MSKVKPSGRRVKLTAAQKEFVIAYLAPFWRGANRAAESARSAMRVDDTGKSEQDLAYWRHAARAIAWVMAATGWRAPTPAEEGGRHATKRRGSG